MDPATRSFLPWLKRGFGTQLKGVPDAGGENLDTAQQLTVELAVNSQGPKTLRPSVKVNLYGPGNVTAFDPRAVIRTWPRNGVFDAESNHYPLIEFDQPDLPWRYTLAQAKNDRLRPWICLIALADDEIESFTGATEGKLATVQARNLQQLPDLSKSWAWAHVQVTGAARPTAADTLKLIQANPAAVISRLICPKELRPKTSYTAFLVPTFEIGVQAGLGQVSGLVTQSLKPAWPRPRSNNPVPAPLLPVYYQWRFQTNEVGDFKYFVNLLMPRAMPETVGLRAMDVHNPGENLPSAASPPKTSTTPQIMLEGALIAPQARPSVWPNNDPVAQSFIQNSQHKDLQTLLDAPSRAKNQPNATPTLVPPLYGGWHANSDQLFGANAPTWFSELNRDPRYRVAAGLGVKVVQDQEQTLLAGAWAQVDGIERANESLRHAQLSQNISLSTYSKNFKLNRAEDLLHVTAPFHARVKGSPVTIKKLIEQSPIPSGPLEPQMRRVMRPYGPIGIRQERDLLPKTSSLLERLNEGELEPAPAPPTPGEMVIPDRIFGPLLPGWLTPKILKWLARLPLLLLLLGLLLLLVALVLFVLGVGAVVVGAIASAGFLIAGAFFPVRQWVNSLKVTLTFRDGTLTAQQVRDLPPRPNFVVQSYPVTSAGTVPPPSSSASGAADSASAAAFRSAAVSMLLRLEEPPAEPEPLQQINMEQVKTTLMTELHPVMTSHQRVESCFTVSGTLGAKTLSYVPADRLAPLMLAPSFEQPMYEPLKALSDDWIIPGLDQVPQNTISLLLSNQRFIEAYMTGLNHEMGRKLMWNRYPTDQPGTYFRQFWKVSGALTTDGQKPKPEELEDITFIETWSKQSRLGQHKPRSSTSSSAQLVLLIRGELLHRYPNVEIYVTKAVKDKTGKRILSADPKDTAPPAFHGSFGADTRFLGFTLDINKATGADGSEGYFFVMQEPPTEPQFGFDVGTPQQHDLLLNDASKNASDLAFQARRQPVRLAVHAKRMLAGLT